MLKINVSVDSSSFQQKLDLLEEIMESGILLDTATALLLNRIRTRFLSEVDPEGRPWVPSKAGLRRRARLDKKGRPGTGTLFDTGRLFRSIQAAGEGPDIRYIGTDVPYAKYHQGSQAKIERRFLGINAEDAQAVERLLRRRLQDALR
jgi:phage gpG-like protein